MLRKLTRMVVAGVVLAALPVVVPARADVLPQSGRVQGPADIADWLDRAVERLVAAVVPTPSPPPGKEVGSPRAEGDDDEGPEMDPNG